MKYPFDVYRVWIVRDGVLSRMGEDIETLADYEPHATVDDLIEAGLEAEEGARVERVPY